MWAVNTHTAHRRRAPGLARSRRAVAAHAHPARATAHAVRALDVMFAIVAPRPSRRASTSSFATSSGPTALVRNTLRRAARWQAQPGAACRCSHLGCFSTWVHELTPKHAGSCSMSALTPRAAQALMAC